MSDKRFDQVESKLDRLDGRLDNIDVTLARQAVSLEEHMKRSALNEEAVNILKDEFKPVQEHVIKIQSAWNTMRVIAIGVSGALAGAVAVISILKYFGS